MLCFISAYNQLRVSKQQSVGNIDHNLHGCVKKVVFGYLYQCYTVLLDLTLATKGNKFPDMIIINLICRIFSSR